MNYRRLKVVSPRFLLLTMATCAFVLAAPALYGASEVSAQEEDGASSSSELPAYQLQRFRPAPGPADYINVFGSAVQPHLEWNAGAYFNHSADPMQLGAYERPGERTVAYQSHLDVMGSVGLFDLVEVGLVIPWTIRQQSRNLGPLVGSLDPVRRDLSSMAVNDLRLTTKYNLFNLTDSPVAVSFVGAASIPLATQNALASDGGFGAEAIVVGEYVFYETIRAAANLGFRYRPGSRQIQELILGNEVTWGLGVHSPFLMDRLDILGELAGAVSVQPRPERLAGVAPGEVPIEARGALRYGINDDWSITGGFGGGLGRGVGAPAWRGFIGVSGKWWTGGWWNVNYRRPGFEAEFDPCDPRVQDQTGRRLRFDPADCPQLADDTDDGVDRTALLDEPLAERPPRRAVGPPPGAEEAEDEEGYATLRHGAIFITESISFETGSAQLVPESQALLDDVAALLVRNSEILLLRIEGHTDSIGDAQMNLELSEDRAKSVRQHLIDAGVEADRLQAVGFGESQPVADNSTAEGRAENRRVEFNVVEFAQ